MLKIITNPNQILRQKSQPVANVANAEIKKLISEMTEIMMTKDGVGLAAPQIGQNIRLIVINHKDEVLVIINPKIVKKSFFKEWGEEGCLSVPGKYGEVKRHKSITTKYIDDKGKTQEVSAKGLLARVIQHE